MADSIRSKTHSDRLEEAITKLTSNQSTLNHTQTLISAKLDYILARVTSLATKARQPPQPSVQPPPELITDPVSYSRFRSAEQIEPPSLNVAPTAAVTNISTTLNSPIQPLDRSDFVLSGYTEHDIFTDRLSSSRFKVSLHGNTSQAVMEEVLTVTEPWGCDLIAEINLVVIPPPEPPDTASSTLSRRTELCSNVLSCNGVVNFKPNILVLTSLLGYYGKASWIDEVLVLENFITVNEKHLFLLSLRLGIGHQWDPGGQLEVSLTTRFSRFKQWDPGKIFFKGSLFTTLRTRLILKGLVMIGSTHKAQMISKEAQLGKESEISQHPDRYN